MCLVCCMPYIYYTNSRVRHSSRRKLCQFNQTSSTLQYQVIKILIKAANSLSFLFYITFFYSLIQFFNKIKNWMEMALMPTDFKDRITRLEHKFAVSTVLFRNFQPLFNEIFQELNNEPTKNNSKSKKHK